MEGKVRELSGNFSVGLNFYLVNMPLCERRAGQSIDKPHHQPPPSHRDVGLGSLLADLGKYSTDRSLSTIML